MYNKLCNCTCCRNTTAGGFEVMEFGGAREGPFSEEQEMELAMELLSVSSEAELEQFLGKMFKGIWKGVKAIAKPLGGVLKGIAKKALPFIGGALGSFIPIPGVGTALGSALGGAVGKALELEFVNMEYEQQEFEIARRFVRIAGTAAQLAAASDGSAQAVRRALSESLLRHVPHYDMGELGGAGAYEAEREGENEGEAWNGSDGYSGRWRQRRAARIAGGGDIDPYAGDGGRLMRGPVGPGCGQGGRGTGGRGGAG